MIDLSTAGSRIALYVDAAFTYNLRLQYGKEKNEVLFTQKLCTKIKEDSRVHATTFSNCKQQC